MKLTFLGTGNAFAPKRDWSCILVNDTILLDASPIALANLKQVDADPAAIRHIFITHFHGDHFFGLPSLLLEYKFLSPTDARLTIVGPRGVEEKVRAAMELAYPGMLSGGWPRPTTFIEATAGAGQSADGLTFDAETMEHGEPDFAALGYRLHLPDGVLAYSGDTRMTAALYDLLAGARVAILEADSGPGERVHLGIESIAALAATLPPTSVAIVNHLDVPGDDPWMGLPVLVPHDLETFTLAFAPDGPPEVRRDSH